MAETRYSSGVLLFPLTAGDRSSLGALEFHCVLAEEHTVENQITGYPTQTGFVISDHAIRKNRRLSLNIIAGGHAPGTVATNTVESSGITPAGEVVLRVSDAQNTHDYLNACAMEGRECQVSTIYGVYNHAIITRYHTKQDVNSVGVLIARIDLQDVYRFVAGGISNEKVALTPYDEEKSAEAHKQLEGDE